MQPYYGLHDRQNGGYLHTGRDARSLEELRLAILSWANGEWGDGSEADVKAAEASSLWDLCEMKDLEVHAALDSIETTNDVHRYDCMAIKSFYNPCDCGGI